MGRFRQARRLQRALQQAGSYQSWLALAEELDQVERNDLWRRDDASPLYHHQLLGEQLSRLRRLRHGGEALQLMRALQESLHRHLGEISNPTLYSYAHAGTKNLISAFYAEVEAAMRFLGDAPIPGQSPREQLAGFEQAFRNFGRSALILSGGVAFGIYHLGVVKALFEQGILPKVISGSSMGAIVAAAACTRDDDELEQFFAHPELIHLDAMRLSPARAVLKHRKLLDSKQLLTHIEANVFSRTFKEAHQHSGRILNVTVSPTRSRQKPRVLNYLTTPDVTVIHSTHASCAMPPAYPPVMLYERDHAGAVIPYMPTERWIDGSLHSDVPLLRLSRLLNVNHSIVSQANPYVLPFIPKGRSSGPIAQTWRMLWSMGQAQAAELLGTSRDLFSSTPALLDQAHAVTKQTYLGDITIAFPFRPTLYGKMLSNPDFEALKLYIRLGEQASWPQVAIVRDQTRVSRTFEEVIARLRRRMSGAE